MSTLRTLTRLKQNTSLLLVRGPEAATFLNGLVSIKMLPSVDKKNQHTITNSDEQTKIGESQIQLDTSNWGLLHVNEWIQWDDPDANEKIGVRRDGRYGLMMKSNGRVLSDFFIYPSPFLTKGEGEPSYLVEFLAPGKYKQIQMMLKLHKLKAKVTFETINADVWEYQDQSDRRYELLDNIVGNYFNNQLSKSSSRGNSLAWDFVTGAGFFNPNLATTGSENLLGFAIDERNQFLGYRFLTKVDAFTTNNDQISNLIKDSSNVSIGTPKNAKFQRVLKGVVEAGDLPATKSDSTLPFEMNVDWEGGINSDKGCYVGQELALRTWTSNSIPKRILPLELTEPLPENDLEGWVVKAIDQDPPDLQKAPSDVSPFASSKTTIKPRRDKSIIGELITVEGTAALCSIRKDYFNYDYVLEGAPFPDQDINKPVLLCKDQHCIKAFIQGQVWV